MQITISVNDKKLIITGVSKVESLIEKAIDNHNTEISKKLFNAIAEALSKEVTENEHTV